MKQYAISFPTTNWRFPLRINFPSSSYSRSWLFPWDFYCHEFPPVKGCVCTNKGTKQYDTRYKIVCISMEIYSSSSRTSKQAKKKKGRKSLANGHDWKEIFCNVEKFSFFFPFKPQQWTVAEVVVPFFHSLHIFKRKQCLGLRAVNMHNTCVNSPRLSMPSLFNQQQEKDQEIDNRIKFSNFWF